MSDLTPILLTPVPIGLESDEFRTIRGWPFADSYVSRLLQKDIPQRVQRGTCRIWGYLGPDDGLVGFGTIDVRDHYSAYSEGRIHPYIPLLAVNPAMQGHGYGKWIVRHLIDQAAILASGPGGYHDVLFLDVYADNEKAIRLYSKCGFVIVEDKPIPDPEESGRPYIIMAMRVSTAAKGSSPEAM
jgi:ribosomal protein S18 acetylase RimI-like enzyme